MFIKDTNLLSSANTLVNHCRSLSYKITCAESCTGGIISAAICSIPGSSKVFEEGFVLYSNEAKSRSLKINKNLIKKYGAVSEVVAKEMSIKALSVTKSNISIAITGIAGPEGGTEKKPVGLVFIAIAIHGLVVHIKAYNFKGTRNKIRLDASLRAIKECTKLLKKKNGN